MVKALHIFITILFLLALRGAKANVAKTEPSQTLCVGCVMIIEIMEQIISYRNLPVEDFVNNQFCELFPSEIKLVCKIAIVNIYGPAIIDGIKNNKNGDQICKELQLCTRQECSLAPPRQFTTSHMSEMIISNAIIKAQIAFKDSNILDWISDIIDKIKNKKPIIDFDDDNFTSSMKGLRGSNWRGKDCNDFDPNIYPGRKANPYPNDHVDFSCNGIYGVNEKGQDWNELLCKNSQQMGVAVLGDSAGALFSIPADYLNATKIDNNTFKNLYDVLLNEIDKPYLSAFTGFLDGDKGAPQNSIYKYLRERNLCNHRDYQNLATNGARTSSVLRNSMSLSRDQKFDHPLMLFVELIGNDVCTPHHTFDRMTKPEDFYRNVMELFEWLDTKLPNGSHVFILGLANGSILYDKLAHEKHPIGYQFSRVYDFLNCVGVNPCWGWLNSNKTVRMLTTERAMQLNSVYRRIMRETNGRFKNFDMLYFDYPAEELMNYWENIGGDPAELIEPIDGFHPSARFHSILADWMWKQIMIYKPNWLGPVNPYNDLIKQKFGDQGGY